MSKNIPNKKRAAKKKAMRIRFDEEYLYKRSVKEDTQIQEKLFYHAETLNSEETRVANDSRLPQTFRTMFEYNQEGSAFLGYPYLQMLSQNPLISAGIETIANEMVKKFAKVVYNGDSAEQKFSVDIEDKIKQLEVLTKKHKIASLFGKCSENIGYYGGCLVYIDTGEHDPETLKSPLILDPATFRQGSLKHFTVIDPINVCPGDYNSMDPTLPDYFKPRTWFVLGKEIHASRLLYFAGKEAPLLYKPSYNFFGVPIAQLVFEFVENFQKNRDSASELLNKFSVSVFKTNMLGFLSGEGTSDIDKRIAFFVEKRQNDGVFAIDKDTEDFMKSDTSLAGVTDIVRQSLELIAAVLRIPVVKYLGISPSGFNATGESDIKIFNAMIESLQKKQFADNLETVLKVLQLNEYGEIDEHIGFEFLPLDEEDDQIKANTEKVQADTAAVFLDRNVISPEEVRKIIAKNKNGLFETIDPDSTDFMDSQEEEQEDFDTFNTENEKTGENAL